MITGDAIRTRSRARPIALAIRCESSSPWPGVNQARTARPSTSSGAGPGARWRPRRAVHSSSKRGRTRRRGPQPSATTTTFSWSVHESSSSSSSRSRPTRRRAPRTCGASGPGCRGCRRWETASPRAAPARLRRRREDQALGMVGVVGDPHRTPRSVASHSAPATTSPGSPAGGRRRAPGRATRAPRRGTPLAPRHLERVAARMERGASITCQRKPAGAMRGSSGLVGALG